LTFLVWNPYESQLINIKLIGLSSDVYSYIPMTTLTFGKYKSQEITSIYESDPTYCRWLHNQNGLNVSPDVKQFLTEKFVNDDGSFLMTWGKYKNKTLKQIQTIDPNYIEWLSKNDFVNTKIPKLKSEVDELLK